MMNDGPGFTPEELARGEDQAWRMPIWGCVAVIALIAAIVWLLLR